MPLGRIATAAVLAALLLAGAGCSDAGIRSTSFPAGDPRTAVITLQRDVCYGRCPIYQVTIDGSGAVRYMGLDYVATGGVKTAQINPAKVAALVRQFRAADFFSLSDRYAEDVKDSPTYCLTLTIGGRTKTVEDYEGLKAGMPKAVDDIEHAVDALSGAEQWIGPRQQMGSYKNFGSFNYKEGARCGEAVLDDART